MANDILVKIMKESKDISHHDFHIHHDFNNSLSNTSFSTALNDAVKPVLKKKKKKTYKKTYIPVSILPITSRVHKRLIYDQPHI